MVILATRVGFTDQHGGGFVDDQPARFCCGMATSPLVTRAQQLAMPVIGFLDFFGRQPKAPTIEAFRAGLADGGFIVSV
jgi:hypothetical protein